MVTEKFLTDVLGVSFSFAFLLIVFLNAAGIISFLIQVFVGIYVSSWILFATAQLKDCCSLFSFGNKIKQIEICKLQFGMKNLWQIVKLLFKFKPMKTVFFFSEGHLSIIKRY